MFSCVVLTKNEEKNIKKCLEGLNFCDEILVIDDCSSDRTVEIAKNQGARIFNQALNGDFAAQRNFALSQAKGEWVLFVDADERISAELAAEIQSQISQPKAGPPLAENVKTTSDVVKTQNLSGFYFKRKDKFLNQWLKYGETASIKLLRLAKKDAGQWQGKIHEVWQVKGKIGELKNPLFHERGLTIAQFLERINSYSSLRSQELYQKGIRTNIFLVILYPLAKFFQNYFLRFGFLDGIPGLIMVMMMSLHSFLVRGKLWIRQQNQGREEFQISNWQKYA